MRRPCRPILITLVVLTCCGSLALAQDSSGTRPTSGSDRLFLAFAEDATLVDRQWWEGRVETANAMLGRPYTVRGAVTRGEARGRELGFPTANLDLENEILPAHGVYAGRVRFLDEGEPARESVWPAVANVGTRPTFHHGGRVLAEAHLIDFDGDLYGRRMELAFVHRLRAERRFDGVDALRAQIRADVLEARRRLEAT